MSESNRSYAAFRLRGFPRIVNDEGIDQRQRPQPRLPVDLSDEALAKLEALAK